MQKYRVGHKLADHSMNLLHKLKMATTEYSKSYFIFLIYKNWTFDATCIIEKFVWVTNYIFFLKLISIGSFYKNFCLLGEQDSPKSKIFHIFSFLLRKYKIIYLHDNLHNCTIKSKSYSIENKYNLELHVYTTPFCPPLTLLSTVKSRNIK